MKEKTKIALTPEQETLLIPLFAKSQADNPIFFDPKAQQILSQVDYDFTQLNIPYKTVILVCQRAKKLDAVTKNFLDENKNGVVLHLGCGLDNRFWRVDNGYINWYDLDMPAVIELRKQFYQDSDRYHVIASSVTELDWMNMVKDNGRPVLVLAEGLLMYLGEDEVKHLVLTLQDRFPGCLLAADLFSRMTAKSATRHRSLRHTGAELGWGIDDPYEIETWSDGIQLVDEWFFSQDPDLYRLPVIYRIAYKVAGAFKVVNRAHRILFFRL